VELDRPRSVVKNDKNKKKKKREARKKAHTGLLGNVPKTIMGFGGRAEKLKRREKKKKKEKERSGINRQKKKGSKTFGRPGTGITGNASYRIMTRHITRELATGEKRGKV